MKKNLIALILLSFAVTSVYGQFLKYYSPNNTTSNLFFNCIVPYGNNFIAGGTYNNQVILVEINSSGDMVKDKTITIVDQTLMPIVSSMIFDSDGQLVIVGNRNPGANQIPFIFRMQYPNCTMTFQELYNNAGAYFLKVIEQSAGGSFLVCGQNEHGVNGGAQDAMLLSINRNTGTITPWHNVDIAGSSETYYSVTMNGANFYTSSRINFIGSGSDKMRPAISKFNNAGVYQMSGAYIRNTTNAVARLYATDLTSAGGNIYLAAHGDGSGAALNKDLYLSQISSADQLVWTRHYDLTNYSPNDGRWNSIKATVSNLFLLGSLYATDINNAGNVFLTKTDMSGLNPWVKSYPFETSDYEGYTQAMLLNGTDVFVVGKKNTGTQTIGVIMKVPQSDGSFACATAEPVAVTTETNVTSVPTYVNKTGFNSAALPTSCGSTPLLINFNTDFTILDQYCVGLTLITSTNCPWANNQWNFYEADANCNIIGPLLFYLTGNNISVPLVGPNFVPGHYYCIKHGVWNDCLPWTETRKCFLVKPFPTADAGPDKTLCPSTNGTISIGPSLILFGAVYNWAPSTYLDDPHAPDPFPTLPSTITPCATQTYTLTVNYNGCAAADAVNVTLINQAPTVTITKSNPCTWCVNPTLTANVSGSCNNNFVWNPGGSTAYTIYPNTSGTYTATASNTCFTTSANTSVTVHSFTGPFPTLLFSNAVDPYDPWAAFEYGKPLGYVPSYNATSYNLKIVNRWGNTIKDTTVFAPCPNGFANGDIQWNGKCFCSGGNGSWGYPEADVYVYLLTLYNCNTTSQQYSGNVTLILRTEGPGISSTVSKDVFSLYPNPAQKHVTLILNDEEANSNQYEVIITDISGKKLPVSAHPTEDKMDIDLDSYTQGIYFICLRNKISGGRFMQKLIVE